MSTAVNASGLTSQQNVDTIAAQTTAICFLLLRCRPERVEVDQEVQRYYKWCRVNGIARNRILRANTA